MNFRGGSAAALATAAALGMLAAPARLALPAPPSVAVRPFGVQGTESVLTQDVARRIDINNINMWVTNFGSYAYDLSTGNAGLEFPRGSGNTACFAAGLWLGATVGE